MVTNHKFLKVFLLKVIVILTLCTSIHALAQEKIRYTLVGEKDFSYAGCLRKEFKVVVQEGITKEEIGKVAKIIYAQKKSILPNLKETQISFYFPDLNVNKDMPNAVANWNIGGSGKWETYYHSLRIKQPKIVDEMDKSVLRRNEFRKGVFITYNLTVPVDTSNKEAKKILKNKLNSLKKEWQNKIEWLGVYLFLGENYLPFMEGRWVSARSSQPKKGINIKIDKNGKHQTKKQTKVLSSEQMRRKIFYESVQAEDKSVRKADQKYPNDFSTRIDYQRKLQAKYEKQLAKKYELTKKHLFKISVEGVSKNWPMP